MTISMKHRFLFFSLFILYFLCFAEEAEILLPEITTYIPASVEQKLVITADDIESAHYESLSEIIEHCGIQMLSYGPYGLESKASIRGFTDETVRVVIDGICVNNAQNGTFDFSSLNLSAIEKIEIIRGGFTEGVEDEGSVAGVIYITMKKVELKPSLSTDVSLKTFFNSERPLDSCFQKINYEGRLAEATFLNASGTLNYAQNRYLYKTDRSNNLCNGIFGSIIETGNWKSQENAHVIDGHASCFLTHYFGNGNYFSIGDFFYAGHKNCPGEFKPINPGLQRDYNNTLSFTLWNPAVSNFCNIKNSIVWSCNNQFYKNQARAENSSHYLNAVKYTGTLEATSIAGGRVQQLAGLSTDFTNLNSTNDGKHNQWSGVIKSTTRVFAGKGWSFSFPMAAKFCVNDDKLNFAFVPKLGAAWQTNILGSDYTQLRISLDVYRMVQFPNMNDLYWNDAVLHGNPNLKPEYGWGSDLCFAVNGIQFGASESKRGTSQVSGSLTIFSDYYKDKIKWGSGTTENLSSAFYLGVDFNIEADFFNKFWILDINGEYLYNRLLDKSQKEEYGNRIMWTPDFVCTVINSFNFEFLKIKLSVSYTGKRFIANTNCEYLKPYLLVNLAAEGVELRNKFTPYIKIDNLLNWQYQSVTNFTMPGISLTLGGKYKFF
ncbi:TonB dependent receptor [Treponema bryantii]|uniref:TonB dependent receptor n=2 Tax=Treponema bryantii TaxID=163 RepID=A0A1H9EIL0_9SPIR|nr:TonB dependent receptor [Treponema bryantii]